MNIFGRKDELKIKSSWGGLITISSPVINVRCRLHSETISIFRQRLDIAIIEHDATGDLKTISDTDLIEFVFQAAIKKQGKRNEIVVYMKDNPRLVRSNLPVVEGAKE